MSDYSVREQFAFSIQLRFAMYPINGVYSSCLVSALSQLNIRLHAARADRARRDGFTSRQQRKPIRIRHWRMVPLTAPVEQEERWNIVSQFTVCAISTQAARAANGISRAQQQITTPTSNCDTGLTINSACTWCAAVNWPRFRPIHIQAGSIWNRTSKTQSPLTVSPEFTCDSLNRLSWVWSL